MKPAPEPARVVALVGATATGKTAVGEALAEALGAEVVCADARQVFRALEIGTGKPPLAERERILHHLFDALALGERASAGWYARACAGTRAAIHARGRVALLVGGSGLYLRAAQHGLASEPPHDPKVRERLRTELELAGPAAMHSRLAAVDPETAARLAPADRQRVSRALEVWESSGRPLSWWHRRPTEPRPAERWEIFELVVEPAELRRRIAARTREMFDHGLVEEVRDLVAAGEERHLRELRAVGYDEALALLSGTLSRAAAEERTSQRTAQLAKRQRTWFRHQVEAMRIDGGDVDRALREIREALERERGSC